MKAVAVIPGRPNSIHLREIQKPSLEQVADGRGVLVKVLRVGVDGTDKEINAAEYGASPPGDDFLIIGHESLGVVEAVGARVSELKPGAFVTATVRRPGTSIYDQIGTYDMTTDDVYFERGINLRHGYLTEYYVESPEYLINVPKGLQHVGVLLEPGSVVEKGIAQAYEIQRRLRVWHPRRAAVLGAGTIGLLATLALRLRGIEVCTFGKQRAPYLNSDLVGDIGACYHSTEYTSLAKAAADHGPFDIIFEATGYSPIVFEAMSILGKNGILVLSSVTGGERITEVQADKLNLRLVLGNQVIVGTVNANREYFETGVKDFSQAELQFPGWLSRLLTHPIQGLNSYREMMDLLTTAKNSIKVYVEIAGP